MVFVAFVGILAIPIFQKISIPASSPQTKSIKVVTWVGCPDMTRFIYPPMNNPNVYTLLLSTCVTQIQYKTRREKRSLVIWAFAQMLSVKYYKY